MAAKARTGVRKSAQNDPKRVVGIGASAGGLEAVRAILEALPPTTGMAFVVVQHLDPEHKSLLVSLLERATPMPTVRIEDGMRLEADHVYVIPEQADVTLTGGILHLQPRPSSPAGHEPFNVLLTSLAEEWKELSVGVILSGSDRDGTVGMAALKAAGGLVLAQDPATAQYESMPRHVIDAGLADAVLSPESIAERLAELTREAPRPRPAQARAQRPVAPAVERPGTRLLQLTDEFLGEDDERAAAIVDADLQVLAFRGDVKRFLTVPTGPATLDLARMVPPDVALELRHMVPEASAGNEMVEAVVHLPVAGLLTDVRVEVVPLPGEAGGTSIVLFSVVSNASATEHGSAEEDIEQRSRREIAALRLQLQDALEEKDAIKEELQSSIEEAQSVNEELQTAKEELQSTNEELITVNDELQERNSELIALNDDLTSLLTSVDMPIVMLGKSLDIRRFTPTASKVLNVIPGDVGRPITDLRLKIDATDLPGALRKVLKTGGPHQQEVRDEEGHWYLLRLLAYRIGGDDIQGVVVSLADIDAAKHASQELEETLEFVAALFDTVREPLVVLDSELRVSQANATFYRYFHTNKAETEGKKLAELGAGQWDVDALTKRLGGVVKKGTSFEDFEVSYLFPTIGARTLLLNGRRVARPHLGGEFVLLAMQDAADLPHGETTIRADAEST